MTDWRLRLRQFKLLKYKYIMKITWFPFIICIICQLLIFLSYPKLYLRALKFQNELSWITYVFILQTLLMFLLGFIGK